MNLYTRNIILIIVVLLSSKVVYSQTIRTQKVSMTHEQLPLTPLTNGKSTYAVVLSPEYLAKAKEAREMTIEKRVEEDNTLGRFVGNTFIHASGK